jgi:hypothetical protein
MRGTIGHFFPRQSHPISMRFGYRDVAGTATSQDLNAASKTGEMP